MVRGVATTASDLRRTTIPSERLSLTSFEQADAGAVFAAIDRTLARFMVWDPPTSLEAFERTGADWLKEGAHGKGYGREAAHALLNWLRDAMRVEFVHYPVVAGDIPSKRLAEALGGKKGGSHAHRKAWGAELKVLEYRIDTGLPIPPPRGK